MEIRNKFGIMMAAAVSRPDLIAVGGNCLYSIMPTVVVKTKHTQIDGRTKIQFRPMFIL